MSWSHSQVINVYCIGHLGRVNSHVLYVDHSAIYLLIDVCMCIIYSLVNQTVFFVCACVFRLLGGGNAEKYSISSPKIRLVHETIYVYPTQLGKSAYEHVLHMYT